MKLLIMQSSPAPHHFLPHYKRESFTPIQKTCKIMVLYILIF
jgi:hypothetical protein